MFLAESSIQLVPDATLLLHLIVIGVMVVVLNRTLLKPINRILSEREKQLSGSRTAAEELLNQRQSKIQQYNAALRDARAEGYRLLEKERAIAMSEKEQRLREVKEEVNKTVSAEVSATRQQQEHVRGELESKALVLGEEISSQIMQNAAR